MSANPDGGGPAGGPRILPDTISFSTSSVTGGNPVTATVVMQANVTENTTAVLTYTASNSGGSVDPSTVCSVPGSVVILNGNISAAVTINTSAVGSSVTVVVTATANGAGVSSSFVIT